MEKEKEKRIVTALKDQVKKLKQLIQAKEHDTACENCSKYEELASMIETLKEENERLKQREMERESF